MFNFTALAACIHATLTLDPSIQYVMCPGSINCICPFNITGTGPSTPECLRVERLNLYCDPQFLIHKARFVFNIFNFFSNDINIIAIFNKTNSYLKLLRK